MIIIDFKIDDFALIKHRGSRIDQLPSYFFTSTLFIMPLRFQASGIELFGFEDDPWGSGPIMCLATEAFNIVKNLKTIKKKLYIFIEGPGDIEFSMIDNENVKIDFDEGSEHIITIVNYDELLDAFRRYSEKVRNYLREYVPQMSQHILGSMDSW